MNHAGFYGKLGRELVLAISVGLMGHLFVGS